MTLPNFRKKLAFTFLAIIVCFFLGESISRGVLFFFRNNESVQFHFSNKIGDYHNNLTWFDRQYEFHPYLNYAPPGIEHTSVENSQLGEFTIAIIGGSFAKGFANYLLGPIGTEHLQELSRELKVSKIRVLNFSAGGYKQPQQLIASSLWQDQADLFISFEGYNELFEHSHGCLPPSWSLVGSRFNPELKSISSRLAVLAKYIFIATYHFAQMDFALGKVISLLTTDRLISTYQYFETEAFKTHMDSAVCKKFGRTPHSTIDNEKHEGMKSWIKFVDQHHRLHSFSRNLITIIQPNQHLSNSKPLSDDEKKMIEINHYDFIDKFYPEAIHQMHQLRLEKKYPIFDFSQIYKDSSETLYIDGCCHVNDAGYSIVWNNLIPILREHIPKIDRSQF